MSGAREDRAPAGGAERGRGASAALLAAAALLFAAASAFAFAGTEGPWRTVSGALALAFGGLALGPLIALTPVEPSPLKLGAFSSTLGLALGGALVLLLRDSAGGGEAAAAVALALGALSALAAAPRRLHLGPPGRAAWCALALAVAAGLGAWFALTSAPGLALRAGSPGAVVHATLAAEWLREGPALDQPWLAGGEAGVRSGPSLVVAFTAAATGLAPLRAAAFVTALAATLLAVGAYLGAAAAGRDAAARGAGVRDVLAAVASLAFAGAAVGVDGLADPAVALALLLGGGASLAALHAARSGRLPWPVLAFALIAAASLAAPVAGLACAALGAWLAARGRRVALGVLLGLACAPGLLEARALEAAGVAPGAAVGAADGRLALGLLALVVVPALFASAHARLSGRPRVVVLVAAAAAALALLVPRVLTRAEALSGLAPALVEADGRLRVAGANERLRGLAGAFAAIRAADLRRQAPGAALLRWSAGAEPAAAAAPSLTPLLTGLPLWWDRAPPPGSGDEAVTALGERRSERGEVARALLAERGAWRARHGRALAGSAARRGALVAVVTDADRRRTAPRAGVLDAPDLALRALGAEVIHEAEGVAVYLLAP